MNQFEEKYKELAKQEKLTVQVVDAIVRSQFEFLTHTMESGDLSDIESFKPFRIPHFGLFMPQKVLIERAIERKKKYSKE